MSRQYPKVRTVTATSLLTALQDYSQDLLQRGVIPSQEALDHVIEVSGKTALIIKGRVFYGCNSPEDNLLPLFVGSHQLLQLLYFLP